MRISSPNARIVAARRAVIVPSQDGAVVKGVADRLDRIEAAIAGLRPSGPSFDAVVVKSLDEERYTFGPLYTPGEVDAHGEYTTGSDLTKAMRSFARSGVRTINKQHNTGAPPVGDIVDWVVWPYEQEVELHVPGRDVRKAVLPAGTAYVGVVWSESEWPAVKGGAVTGYSLGGRAMRVQTGELLPPMRR